MIALSQQATKNDPDAELMLRVQAGDEDAFGELMQRNSSKVIGFLRRLMGGDQQLEDLAQDVFLKIYRARHSYVVISRFTTWMYAITNNVAMNAHRRLGVRRELTAGKESELHDSPFDYLGGCFSDECPVLAADRNELRQAVRQGVTRLNSLQRLAVSMFYFQGMSYREIAREMDASESAIKSLLNRAREKLKELLTPYWES